MNNTTPATSQQDPSGRSLLRSTALAAAAAILILVTIVLPAEYGIDPTRIGGVLGLTEMGETKMALAREEAGHEVTESEAAGTTVDSLAAPVVAPAAADSAQRSVAVAGKSDSTEIMLLPNEGKEIKLAMQKDARVTFSWSTNKGVVNFDTHGDSPTLKYHGYGKGSGVKSDEGVLTAAFDGHHGWFWRNRSSEPVVVTLRTTGDYQELLRMP